MSLVYGHLLRKDGQEFVTCLSDGNVMDAGAQFKKAFVTSASRQGLVFWEFINNTGLENLTKSNLGKMFQVFFVNYTLLLSKICQKG